MSTGSRAIRPLLAALAAAALSAATAGTAVAAPTGAAEKYVVVLRDDVVDAFSTAASHGARYGATVSHTYRSALTGYAGTFPAGRVAELKADPRVAYVTPDTEVFASATAPVTTGDEVPPGLRRIGAATTTTAHAPSDVNVAVIDTGIDLKHSDLNAVHGTNCIRSGSSSNDDHGHGSHVAGTIAARNNGSGVVGVAPGTKLYAVKVLNRQGSGTLSSVICGIDWVTANAKALNIGVANMSLGGGGSNDNNCGRTNNDAEHAAICRSVAAGVHYVVAAGNSNADLAGSVPAAYPEVLTVTAMSDTDGAGGGTGPTPTCRTGEVDDRYASFSNYATTAADLEHTIAAPGVCIRSTYKSGGYDTISGTSMASPHVAGLVALCLGNGGVAGPCAGLSPAQVISKVRSDAQAQATTDNGFTGDPLRPVTGKSYGYLAWAGGY